MGLETTLHEVKGAPLELDETHIVEAFGNRKCSKLVEQVKSSTRAIRVNALSVLADEFHQPMSVVGCCKAGVVPVLAGLISEPDTLTRVRASAALAICAHDANGRTAMLEAQTPAAIAGGLDDADEAVRSNVYRALINFGSSTMPAVRALVAAKYPAVLVAKAGSEVEAVQPLVLRLLTKCLGDGLSDALAVKAVPTCIALLTSPATAVRKEAAATLNVLCFAEMAKIDAIGGDAVAKLCALLTDADVGVRAAAAGALAAVTTTDAGKKAIIPAQGVVPLMALLASESSTDGVRLNTLKAMANVAVHPTARKQLKDDAENVATINRLTAEGSKLIQKHALLTKKAVGWTA